MSSDSSPLDRLLELSHQLGREDRKFSMLGEGNTSTRTGADTFIVKASGSNLGSLTPLGVTECRFSSILPMIDGGPLTDTQIDDNLLQARVDKSARKPSTEALFHAYLLTLPGVNFVGHTHPVTVNQLLCSKFSRTFARRRLFPDEIVCCGVESVLVPYTDPGLKLAKAIRRAVIAYIRRLARPPRVILLENHGFIALAATPEGVLATTMMGAKAAEIFVGAAAAAGSPRFLPPAQVARIAGRPDEHYRQKVLSL